MLAIIAPARRAIIAPAHRTEIGEHLVVGCRPVPEVGQTKYNGIIENVAAESVPKLELCPK
jgi:hypothetical protein